MKPGTSALLSTPLTQALGCRYPIIQTAMGWVSDADLVFRFRSGHELARFDTASLYTAGSKGYTGYSPVVADIKA